jgi:hypothetical protein
MQLLTVVQATRRRILRREGGSFRRRMSIRAEPVRVEGENRHNAGDYAKERHEMKQYLLSVYQPQGEPPPPEVLAGIMADLEALNEEMKAAGAWVFTARLHAPSTATVVRLQDGDVLTTDGPYVEGKEYIGGFTIINAPDLDAALEWGRKVARASTLPIEVRPFAGAVEG